MNGSQKDAIVLTSTHFAHGFSLGIAICKVSPLIKTLIERLRMARSDRKSIKLKGEVL